MSCVVDASVALKWFLADEPYSDTAWTLARAGEPLIAPDLVVAETCNAAWKCFRLKRMEAEEVFDLAATLPRFFAELADVLPLAPRAALMAIELGHPVYDCFYLALAESRQVPLLTVDTRFLSRLAGSPWETRAMHLAAHR